MRLQARDQCDEHQKEFADITVIAKAERRLSADNQHNHRLTNSLYAHRLKYYKGGYVQAIVDILAACWGRLIIWGGAMVVALFPSLHASKIHYPWWNIEEMAKAVGRAGFFQDFYFVVIIAAIIGVSNIIYSVFFFEKRTRIWIAAIFITAILYFFYISITGVLRFAEIARNPRAVDVVDFAQDLAIIHWTLIIGAFTEVVVALRERFS